MGNMKIGHVKVEEVRSLRQRKQRIIKKQRIILSNLSRLNVEKRSSTGKDCRVKRKSPINDKIISIASIPSIVLPVIDVEPVLGSSPLKRQLNDRDSNALKKSLPRFCKIKLPPTALNLDEKEVKKEKKVSSPKQIIPVSPPKPELRVKLTRLLLEPKDQKTFFLCSNCDTPYKSPKARKNHSLSCTGTLNGEESAPSDLSPKELYMVALGLHSNSKLPALPPVLPVDEECLFASESKSRLFRNSKIKSKLKRISNYFSSQPVPITSERGMSLIRKSQCALVTDMRSATDKIDEICTEGKIVTKTRGLSVKTVFKNKGIPGKGDGINGSSFEYSFNRTERIKRYSRLLIGMTEDTFNIYQSLPFCRVLLEKLSDEKIAALMQGDIREPINEQNNLPSTSSSSVVKEQLFFNKTQNNKSTDCEAQKLLKLASECRVTLVKLRTKNGVILRNK